MTGLCLSRRTVLCTRTSVISLVRAFAFPYRNDISCLPTHHPVAPPCLWICSLPRSWMSSLFLKPSGQSFWIQPALKFGNLLNMSMMSRTGQVFSPVWNHRSWTVCISRRSDAHTKQHVRETPSFSPGVATIQAKIWTHQSSQTGGVP